jgi:hypothetical protein
VYTTKEAADRSISDLSDQELEQGGGRRVVVLRSEVKNKLYIGRPLGLKHVNTIHPRGRQDAGILACRLAAANSLCDCSTLSVCVCPFPPCSPD